MTDRHRMINLLEGRWLACALGLALVTAPAAAGFSAYRIDAEVATAGPVRLDGTLDHPAWRLAPVHDRFFEAQPEDQIEAKVRTEVRLLVDQRHLYVGIKAFDPRPNDIRSPFARRDKLSNEQDYVGLYIDPSGAATSAQVIYVNARGAVSDGTHSPIDGDNLLPDFRFDAATARFDGGWTAVLRIPFSSIAYDSAQTAPWKLLVMRNMPREQRFRMYSGPVTRNTNCILCFAQAVDNLDSAPRGLNWSATVQAVASQVKTSDAPTKRGQALSLDIKLRPDSASIIDATIKPDFSQVELDSAQLVGNTRFALFVSEKRPFFLEGSDLLQTPLRAISTRSITAPSWGARYTRRETHSDFTLLSAHDGGGGLVPLPSAYDTGFARQPGGSQATLARALFKQGSTTWGLIGSDRSYGDGQGFNRVLGGDFVWQPRDTERLRGQLLLSSTTALADGRGGLRSGAERRGHAAFLTWSHDQTDWAASLTGQDLSDGFRADNGFFSQVGYRDLNALMIKKQGKSGLRNELNWYLFAGHKSDHAGRLIGAEMFPGFWMAGPNDSELDFHVKPAVLTRVAVDGPLFRTAQLGGRVGITPSPLLARLQLEIGYGEQLDVVGSRVGRGGNLTLFTRLRPSARFELEASYFGNWIDGRGGVERGQRLLTDQALQLQGIAHFGAQDSLRATAQHSLTRRDARFYASGVAPEYRQSTSSLVYWHTAGLGATLHAGVTRTRSELPGLAPTSRHDEGFVKLSWQY